MYFMTKALNNWKNCRNLLIGFQYKNSLKSETTAFQSTLSQRLDEEVSEDYKKDLPDPTLSNPYVKEKRQCILCKYNIHVDYKNVRLISQFVSPYTGRLYDKHITGLCEKQHNVLKNEHKKAIQYSLISAVYRDPKFHRDPRLFDPTRPQRPNPY